MENEVTSFLTEWKEFLESLSEQMQLDIRKVLSGETIQYKQSQLATDIVALYFEYQYDVFDVAVWGENKAGEPITETLFLRGKNEDPEWKHLISKDIWDKDLDLSEELEEEEEDDLHFEYNQQKRTVFEDWFTNCWNIAVKDIQVTPDVYFSIHDTNTLTDLKTGEEINSNQIKKNKNT